MPPALLTADQSRWALSLLVGLLSAVAIVSSVPNLIETESILNGHPGDIRGVLVIIGGGGVASIFLSRLAAVLLPKPWRIYIDRIEFTLVTMLWICWTSATMAFSAFTLGEGVCASSRPEIFVPTCPLLTFDMAILHLLSTATFAHLLVILSTALSPSYYLSMSTLADGSTKADPATERMDGFVMWDLAVLSPPPSPGLQPSPFFSNTSPTYGTIGSTTPLNLGNSPYDQPKPPNSDTPGVASSSSQTLPPTGPTRRDRFAEGRILSYVSLLLCSIGVVGATAVVMALGEFVMSCMVIIAVGVLSTSFSLVFLRLHSLSDKLTNPDRKLLLRSLEVGCAFSLFILWPLAAIAFTLFPSIPNRACTNPAASALPIDPDATPFSEDSLTCYLSLSIISLAWGASWIVLARVVGLVFPMPVMTAGGGVEAVLRTRADGHERGGEEGRSLLRSGSGRQGNPYLARPGDELSGGGSRKSTGKGEGKGTGKGKGNGRPQMGWGRMVAGEAFELGGDEDEDEA